MAYATADDVEAALGRSLGSIDVSFLLETASDRVLAHLNLAEDYAVGEVPPAVARVVAEMVAAVLNRPQTPPDPNDDAYNVGAFAYHVGPQSVGPWLSKEQKSRLEPYRTVGWLNLQCIGETTGSDVWTSVSTSFDPYAGTDLTSEGTVADI